MATINADLTRLVGEHRYEQAAELLARIGGESGTSRRPWALFALRLAALDRFAELFHLIELRQQHAGDGLELFYECVSSARSLIGRAAALRLIAATPRDSLLSIVAQFFAGVLATMDGDVEGGIAQMKFAGTAACAFLDRFRVDPYLCSIPQAAALLEGSAAVAAIEAADRSALIAACGWLEETIELPAAGSAAPEARFVFLSSCDERYLDRFGASVTRALDETGARTLYHLHVVDPTPELPAKIARLQAGCAHLTLRYSTERCRGAGAPGPQRASYYACARLVRLPEILAHYRRDVFIWDVDVARVRRFDTLAGAMAGYDLGYFEMKDTTPSFVCHLACAYFADTPATRRLAGLVANYVLAKLPRSPFWMLDQSALYCATRYLAGSGAGLRIKDFWANPALGFYDLVDVAGSTEEKRHMRNTAGG